MKYTTLLIAILLLSACTAETKGETTTTTPNQQEMLNNSSDTAEECQKHAVDLPTQDKSYTEEEIEKIMGDQGASFDELSEFMKKEPISKGSKLYNADYAGGYYCEIDKKFHLQITPEADRALFEDALKEYEHLVLDVVAHSLKDLDQLEGTLNREIRKDDDYLELFHDLNYAPAVVSQSKNKVEVYILKRNEEVEARITQAVFDTGEFSDAKSIEELPIDWQIGYPKIKE